MFENETNKQKYMKKKKWKLKKQMTCCLWQNASYWQLYEAGVSFYLYTHNFCDDFNSVFCFLFISFSFTSMFDMRSFFFFWFFPRFFLVCFIFLYSRVMRILEIRIWICVIVAYAFKCAIFDEAIARVYVCYVSSILVLMIRNG